MPCSCILCVYHLLFKISREIAAKLHKSIQKTWNFRFQRCLKTVKFSLIAAKKFQRYDLLRSVPAKLLVFQFLPKPLFHTSDKYEPQRNTNLLTCDVLQNENTIAGEGHCLVWKLGYRINCRWYLIIMFRKLQFHDKVTPHGNKSPPISPNFHQN